MKRILVLIATVCIALNAASVPAAAGHRFIDVSVNVPQNEAAGLLGTCRLPVRQVNAMVRDGAPLSGRIVPLSQEDCRGQGIIPGCLANRPDIRPASTMENGASFLHDSASDAGYWLAYGALRNVRPRGEDPGPRSFPLAYSVHFSRSDLPSYTLYFSGIAYHAPRPFMKAGIFIFRENGNA